MTTSAQWQQLYLGYFSLFFYSGRKWRCFASLYMSVVPTIISCQLKMAAKIATMTCNKVNKKVNEGTDLCVFTQVDPFGDVVDGGDPLMEEAAERRCKDTTEQLTVNTEQVMWRKNTLPPRSPSCSPTVESQPWQNKTSVFISCSPINTIWKLGILSSWALSLLAIEGSDLETEAAVVTVDRHNGAVVEVCYQPACHLTPALLHQITALRKEVLPLPGRRHQPCFTKRQRS